MSAPTAERAAAALAAARRLLPEVVAATAAIAAIPAPTGQEGERGAYVAEQLRAAGLSVATDELGDVVARLPGRERGAPLLIAAHLDTVFPAGTPLTIRRDGHVLHGPGIGDNSLGVAALLALPRLLAALDAQPAVDLLLAATVGEEGLGDLRGMRAVCDAHPELGAAIALEGHNLGRVTHTAVGSRRLRIRLAGPGGHSWGDFGRPSAIHALSKLIAELDAIPLPGSPKTTLNVGVVEGGVSVNTIAPSASCLLDLRSVDADALGRLVEEVERVIARANRGEIRVEAEVIGDRPAGTVPPESRIVRIATATLHSLGVAAIGDASSTDANIPISRGLPAVCLGLTTGANVHRTDERIDTEPIPLGLAQLALVATQVAEDLASGRPTP